jgi:hypothetical protein
VFWGPPPLKEGAQIEYKCHHTRRWINPPLHEPYSGELAAQRDRARGIRWGMPAILVQTTLWLSNAINFKFILAFVVKVIMQYCGIFIASVTLAISMWPVSRLVSVHATTSVFTTSCANVTDTCCCMWALQMRRGRHSAKSELSEVKLSCPILSHVLLCPAHT